MNELEKEQRLRDEYLRCVNNVESYMRAIREMIGVDAWEPAHNITRLAIEELQAANDMVFDAKLSGKEKEEE